MEEKREALSEILCLILMPRELVEFSDPGNNFFISNPDASSHAHSESQS